MKPILNQEIIDNYILDKFGEIPNPPTKDEMIELINYNELTLEGVNLWSLFGGDLLIKDIDGNTILHSASQIGQINIIQYVLNKGVGADTLNNYNSTPLLYASMHGQIEVINLLLGRGANINYQNKWGWSALHYACQSNKLECVKVLIENDIDIHLKNDSYDSALNLAKEQNYNNIVNYFILNNLKTHILLIYVFFFIF